MTAAKPRTLAPLHPTTLKNPLRPGWQLPLKVQLQDVGDFFLGERLADQAGDVELFEAA